MKLETFLNTLSPMAAGRARKSLEIQVRVNGDKFMTRAAMIEERVASGAQVTELKNWGRVLMLPDGAFLDQRNATGYGLDYASYLAEERRA